MTNLRLNRERLQRIDDLLSRGVENKHFPCAVYRIDHHGERVAAGAFGSVDPYGANDAPATLDTRFDLASITKTFTGVLLLMAAQEGMLHLEQRVQDFFPEFPSLPSAQITLKQLATHVSGLPPWKPLYRSSEQLSDILATHLEQEPGIRYAYSDLGYILLAEILQRVSDLDFRTLVQHWILDPLHLNSIAYAPSLDQGIRFAATANCPLREGRTLVGEVHDANAYSMSGISGHAGLFSDIEGVADYVRGLPQLLSPLALDKMKRSQIPDAVGGHSVGWFTAANAMLPKGDFLSDQCYGHTGFTGTTLLIDPVHSLTLILLTNRVYYPHDGAPALRLRRHLANLVASSLVD